MFKTNPIMRNNWNYWDMMFGLLKDPDMIPTVISILKYLDSQYYIKAVNPLCIPKTDIMNEATEDFNDSFNKFIDMIRKGNVNFGCHHKLYFDDISFYSLYCHYMKPLNAKIIPFDKCESKFDKIFDNSVCKVPEVSEQTNYDLIDYTLIKEGYTVIKTSSNKYILKCSIPPSRSKRLYSIDFEHIHILNDTKLN